MSLGTLALAAVTAGLVFAVAVLTRPAGDAAAPGTDPPAPSGPQDTVVLVRHDGEAEPAAGITLLAVDQAAGRGAVVFVPTDLLVEIPGVGLDRVGLAHQYGGADLVAAAVANALGIDVDHAVAVSNTALGAALQRIGGLEIDVPSDLLERAADGSATVAFPAGPQRLDGPALVRYWGFAERSDSQLDTFPRQQQVWQALLTALRDRDLLQAFTDDRLPLDGSTLDSAGLAGLLAGLAAAEVSYSLVPVEPFGSADADRGGAYRLREDAAAELVDGLLAGSVPAGADGEPLAVQVLNGVGRPGVGQEVDAALDGAGFRIVLTDNARDFNFTHTRIVVYSESPEITAAAERVRDLLGVGTILVSRQPQSVVDLTIVVGADFQPPTS